MLKGRNFSSLNLKS